jgi:AcrR family transcriptional regulator
VGAPAAAVRRSLARLDGHGGVALGAEVRRRRRGEETRALILDAAEALLREGSYRDLSVNLVMERAGYRRTVFYRHFAGLPELVIAVLSRHAEAATPAGIAFQEAAAETVDVARTREVLRPAVEHWRANGRLIAALRDGAIHDGFLARVAQVTQTRLEATILEGLQRRHAAGALQSADLPDLARLLASMGQGYLLYALGRNSVDAERVLDTLALAWTAIVNAP